MRITCLALFICIVCDILLPFHHVNHCAQPKLVTQYVSAPVSRRQILLYLLYSSSPLPISHFLQLQSKLHVSVKQVQVDECVYADCKAAGGCSTHLSISDLPTLVDSGNLSLVSVKVTSSAVCGCAAREMTHQPCSSYPSNPCLHGGTCIDTQNGYR